MALITTSPAGAARPAPINVAVCPMSLPPPGSRGSAARQELVPEEASSLTLCRYHGGELKRGRMIRLAGGISTLTREFNALRRMPPGSYSCPADFAVVITATFRYGHAPPDRVEVDTTGCEEVRNGQIVDWAFFPPGPTLLRQLLGDTGCVAERPSAACA